ncbi:hypothetical protein BJ508DRAFT_410403 [Ascobolus immersus RN42]|uniref:Uncharacterized protein n=1 Tax=Ascobolus immersus RN42 TaxID=1160509 RepID=A0A3N4J155_ASCIM|nr:hypothetical protein BJ508DRAFT_410403 [Ascobolus immersus RN42]
MSTSTSAPQHEAQLTAILSKSHAPDTVTDIITYLADKPVPIDVTGRDTLPSKPLDERARRRIERNAKKTRSKKPQPLTAKQKRKLGLLALPKEKEASKYSLYAPLRDLWQGYARELLFGRNDGWKSLEDAKNETKISANNRNQELTSRVASMEFCGADVEVVRCKSPERVGIAGTIVREGRGGFWICRKSDGWAVVPKEGTAFRITINPPDGLDGAKPMSFDILGDGMIIRPAERANRKFKPRVVLE